MTISIFYNYYLQQLQKLYSLNEAAAIANIVFETKAGIRRDDRIKEPGIILNEKIIELLTQALKQLLQHRPMQYVLGETSFYNLKLKVNEQVLIPRPETEELVEWVIEDKKQMQDKKLSVLDIGTGSGCIAIALKKNLPLSKVTAMDISAGSLRLAGENAENNKVNIEFIQADFLNKGDWKCLPSTNIIVSNPPYIPAGEKEKLDRHVKWFEPHAALIVPNDLPLLFYENIILFSKAHLEHEGSIYVETHEDYADQTAAIFSQSFKQVKIKKDMNGKSRMIRATRSR